MRGARPSTILKMLPGTRDRRIAFPIDPDGEGPGGAPEGFDDARAAVWREIVAGIPKGVAGPPDRFLIEIACALLTQVRADPSPSASLLGELRKCLGELGMTPASRTRFVIRPKVQNPFAELDDVPDA